MKRIVATLALSTAMLVPAISAQAATYTSYYAFGDSLTDDGKLGLPLPYDRGRFSSGPVWADYITRRFSGNGLNTENFALGGATAGDANTNTDGDLTNGEYPPAAIPFANFNSQIDVFTPLGLSSLTGDNPIISVLFGANDIFQGGDPISAANAVADGIQRLVDLAPKFNDFLVSTLPELGDTPDAVTNLTIAGAFNLELDNRLSAIESTGINIIDLNQNLFQTQLFPRLPSLGVTNFAGPCLVTPTATTPGFDCTIVGFEADGTPIRDLSIADTYYLIDSVHPSEIPQREFGRFAIEALGDELPSAVPLPAGTPLLLAGLGAFAWMRRRQRAV